LKSETKKMDELPRELSDLYDQEISFPARPVKFAKMSHKNRLKFNDKYDRIIEPINDAASELVYRENGMVEIRELMKRIDDIFGSVIWQIQNAN